MSKLLAVALALLTTTAGVAVAAPPGGAGPVGPAANGTAGGSGPAAGAGNGTPAADAGDRAGGGPPEAANGSEAASAGPPADLPDAVPDFVGSIHDLVREHVNGGPSGHGLGEALQDLLGGGSDGGESGGGADAPDAPDEPDVPTATPDTATPTPNATADGAAA